MNTKRRCDTRVEVFETIPGFFEQIMIFKKKEDKAGRIPIRVVEEVDPQASEQEGADRDLTDDVPSSGKVGGASTPVNEEEERNSANLQPADEADTDSPEAIEPEEVDEPAPAATLADGDEPNDADKTESLEGADEDSTSSPDSNTAAGPLMAELVATRAELRRVETERNDLLERLARRQADFENYRKRVDRERGETYQRLVGDVVSKLLPVMDNMRRALEAESLLEKNESAEFRHFLRGVELIYKQLNGALEDYGVEPVLSVGQPFDPHLHEAVATEHSDDYEPDTVTQELLRGYRLGDKLLRPAMVKVSTRQ